MIRFIAFDCVKDHFLQNEVRRDELPTYISLHISLLCFTASAHHRISNHILATHLPFPRPNHPITPGRASSATTCPLAPLVSRKLQGDVKNTSRQLILRWLLTGSYQIQFSWMLGNISYQRGWIHSKEKKKHIQVYWEMIWGIVMYGIYFCLEWSILGRSPGSFSTPTRPIMDSALRNFPKKWNLQMKPGYLRKKSSQFNQTI